MELNEEVKGLLLSRINKAPSYYKFSYTNLAKASELSVPTIKKIEEGDHVSKGSLIMLRDVLSQ